MYSKTYADDELFEYLRKAREKLGKIPTEAEYDSLDGFPNVRTIIRRFWSWNQALRKCFKLHKKYSNNFKYTDEEVILKLKEFAKRKGKTPTSRDLVFQEDMPSLGVYEGRWGCWNNALKAAGLEPNYKIEYTKLDLKNKLIAISKDKERTPMIKDLKSPCVATYQERFGSWNNALRYSGFKPNKVKTDRTDEELLNECSKIIDEFGVINADVLGLKQGNPTMSLIRDRFGSINNLYLLLNKKRECVVCGFNLMLDAHHLNGKKNNKKGELIWLCSNHHRLLHYKNNTIEILKTQHREFINKLIKENEVLNGTM